MNDLYAGMDDINLDELEDASTLADGTEAHLQIIEVKPPTEEEMNGPKEKYSTLVLLRVMSTKGGDDVELVNDIRHYVNYPKPSDDRKKTNTKLVELKRFCQAFGVVPNPDSFEDWVGSEGNWILTVENDDKYGPQNKLRFRGAC